MNGMSTIPIGESEYKCTCTPGATMACVDSECVNKNEMPPENVSHKEELKQLLFLLDWFKNNYILDVVELDAFRETISVVKDSLDVEKN